MIFLFLFLFLDYGYCNTLLGIQFKFNLIQYLILGTTLSCLILPRIRPITLEWHKSHEKYIKWNIILIIYRQVMSWKCQPEIISFRGDRFFRILPCSLNTLMVWQRQKSKTQNLNATFTQYPEGKSELINLLRCLQMVSFWRKCMISNNPAGEK